MKALCGHNQALQVCLEISEDIVQTQAEIGRWKCEQIGMIMLRASAFITDSEGAPTLSAPHQGLLKDLFPFCSRIVLEGKNVNDYMEDYRDSLFQLFDTLKPYTDNEVLDYSYKDYLQSPLQPLMNNLESMSYETFENDTVKYTQYQAALTAALNDYKQFGYFKNQRKGQPTGRPEEDEKMRAGGEGPVKILLAGAGRGPIIRCAFRASEAAGVDIRVVAVEKNPNAIVTLRNLTYSEPWGRKLTVVRSDIRELNLPETFDIVVSELLGSFGDNELSPECLDGAQRFLARPNGIFIPYRYISYLQPLSSAKLWTEVRNLPGPFAYEIPYVVKIYSGNFVGAPTPVFEFAHPNDPGVSNARDTKCDFVNDKTFPTIVHGFAGYFDAFLYDDVHASIVPTNHTEDMHSWFPIYFPLREPVLAESSDAIHVHVWRCISSTKVWYEWSVDVESKRSGTCRTTGLHNTKGRAYAIGLY